MTSMPTRRQSLRAAQSTPALLPSRRTNKQDLIPPKSFHKPFHEAYDEYERIKELQFIKDLFMAADTNQSGTLDYKEFAACMSQPETFRIFNTRFGLQRHQAPVVFRAFDIDGSGQISLTEWFETCTFLIQVVRDGEIISNWRQKDLRKMKETWESWSFRKPREPLNSGTTMPIGEAQGGPADRDRMRRTSASASFSRELARPSPRGPRRSGVFSPSGDSRPSSSPSGQNVELDSVLDRTSPRYASRASMVACQAAVAGERERVSVSLAVESTPPYWLSKLAPPAEDYDVNEGRSMRAAIVAASVHHVSGTAHEEIELKRAHIAHHRAIHSPKSRLCGSPKARSGHSLLPKVV